MSLRIAAFAFSFAALAFSPTSASAAESFDGCKYVITSLPAVLTTQGVWCLKGDLSTATTSGNAITIAANNVTLDCNYFKLGGLAAGPTTQAVGIGAEERSNPTIRNCNVRGFLFGVHMSGVSAPTVEDSVFEGNTYAGIWLEGGDDAMVRRNRIVDTGGTPTTIGGNIRGTGIFVEMGADVIDNVVNGVTPTAADTTQSVGGIYSYAASGTFVGNRIRNLHPKNGGSAYGIRHFFPERAASNGNFVNLGGQPGGTGIFCDAEALGVARDNTLLGTAVGVYGCVSDGNYIDVD